MRGADTFTESPFTLHRLEDFVPADHPLRPIRQMVNEALGKMDGLFAAMYEAPSKGGRPSIAPEKLLCAMLLQVFYSIRSERQLMEQVQYNLLYRWFIGLAMEEAVWVPTVFTKNRERLLAHDAVIELFNHVLQSADEHDWLSGEHFTRLSRPGRATRALCARTAAMSLAAAAVSRDRRARTRRTSPPPMPTPGCTARGKRPASCASWATR